VGTLTSCKLFLKDLLCINETKNFTLPGMHFLVNFFYFLNCLFALRMTGTSLQNVPLVVKLASSKKPCT